MKEKESAAKNTYFIGDHVFDTEDRCSIEMDEGDYVNIDYTGKYLSRTKKQRFSNVFHEESFFREGAIEDCVDWDFVFEKSPEGFADEPPIEKVKESKPKLNKNEVRQIKIRKIMKQIGY